MSFPRKRESISKRFPKTGFQPLFFCIYMLYFKCKTMSFPLRLMPLLLHLMSFPRKRESIKVLVLNKIYEDPINKSYYRSIYT
jgi:hypothetical protein